MMMGMRAHQAHIYNLRGLKDLLYLFDDVGFGIGSRNV
jgi:hypothetical protein